jgi:hypothetical protein
MSSKDPQNNEAPLDKDPPPGKEAPREKKVPEENDVPREKDVPVEGDVPAEPGEEQACDPERWKFLADLPPRTIPPNTEVPYSSFLVIRSMVGDNGTRPLPPATEYWAGPDVWVESRMGVDQPIPGEDNTVFARVSNWGLQDATGVIIEFYFAIPGLAITTPTLIGIGYANIQSGDSAVVECPTKWVPDSINGGHQCLIVQAYIPLFDDLTSPQDPFDDRHVGQKNQQLVQLAPGEFFVTTVQAANPMGIAQQLTFEVQPLQRVAAPPPVLAQRSVDALEVKAAPPALGALPLTLRLDDSSSSFSGPSAVFARRLLSQTLREMAGASRYCLAPAQITHTAQFEPWETRTIEIAGQVPLHAQPGQAHSFDIVQRTGRMINGGYRVNVVVGEKSTRKDKEEKGKGEQ